MLCFNKSWRSHNRETQTFMNNSVVEFGDTHQACLCSFLSFSLRSFSCAEALFHPPTPRTQPVLVGDVHITWGVPGVSKFPVLNVGLGVRTQQLKSLILLWKMVLLTDTGQKVCIFKILT